MSLNLPTILAAAALGLAIYNYTQLQKKMDKPAT